MALGKRLINTGAAAAACLTETTDIFGDSSGVALYSLDYDASDESGTYDGTPTNVDFGVGGQINYGARFNGSSSKITLPASTSIAQQNNYSISIWFNTDALNDFQTVFAFNHEDTYMSALWLHSNGTNNLRAFVAGNNYYSSDNIFSKNQWHHVVITKSSTDGLKVYFDNTLAINEPTVIGNNLQVSGSTRENNIGANKTTAETLHFDGSIDQVRIFNKALNQTEVDTLYAETACVYTSTTDIVNYPTGTTPIAYYKLDNSSEDYSTGGNDGTDTDIEYRFGRFGQAAVFNGSSSNIFNSNRSATQTDTISISAWMKTSDTSTSMMIVQTESIWVRSDYILRHDNYNGTGNYRRYNYTQSTVATGNWIHVCVVRDGTSVTLYVNNTAITFDSESTSSNSGVYDGISIGARNRSSDSNKASHFDGSIDQVRIYDAALTSDQVTELYNEKPEVDTSNFKTVLYTGDGGTEYISNVGFQPDLVWIKNRTSGTSHKIFDSIRGATNFIESDTTDAEGSNASTLQSFDANGFTQGGGQPTGENGSDIVAWCWKGGGDAVPNTDGDLATQVSVNKEAGFSIATYTGFYTGGDTTKSVGHGFENTKPDIFIVKNRTRAKDWYVYTDIIDGSMDFLYLNGTDAKGDSSRAVSTNSVNYIGGASTNNVIGDEYVVYSFHSVPNYSSIGSYSGGSTSTISTGFKPSFLLVKQINASGQDWHLFDSVRGGGDTFDEFLKPNTNEIESSASNREVNFTNDGFNFSETTSNAVNTSGNTYIYMAFK